MLQVSVEQTNPLHLLLPAPCTARPLSHSAAHIPLHRRLPPSQQFSRSNARRSTAENTSGEYLHTRLMRRKANTPLHKFEEMQRDEPREEPPQEGGFVRTRNFRAVSLGRTTTAQRHREPPQETPRPTTSHGLSEKAAYEKAAYFDEVLSTRDGLKQLRVMSHIGKGAFSVVSMAVGRESKQSYAVKTYEKLDAMDWNRLACIKREVRHLRGLDSERVVKLHGVAREHRKLYLVMENAGRTSLAGMLRKEGRLKETTARKYLREILEGVAYIHAQGICHRDLKPENILLDSHGSVKLIDFGFSASTRTPLNTLCGTPAYMCPELARKTPYSGAKADVWAVGIMLYLMLVGVLPFRAATEQELFRLIAAGKVKYRDEGLVSPSARRLIGRMLAVAPQLRPSAEELLGDPWVGSDDN